MWVSCCFSLRQWELILITILNFCLLKLNMYIDFSANVYIFYWWVYQWNGVAWRYKEQLQSYWRFLDQKVAWLDSTSLDLKFSFFTLNSESECCILLCIFFHNCPLQLRCNFVIKMRMSTVPTCVQGQLFVCFQRMLVYLCDLTRLKTLKLSHTKTFNFSLTWISILFLNDH